MSKKRKTRNPVARHLRTFNKATVQKDKKKEWKKGKKTKHKKPHVYQDCGVSSFCSSSFSSSRL